MLLYLIQQFKKIECYRPYKQDSTGTKRELVLDQDQCAKRGTNGTSGAMGRGVAESHDWSRAMYRTYSRTHVLAY